MGHYLFLLSEGLDTESTLITLRLKRGGKSRGIGVVVVGIRDGKRFLPGPGFELVTSRSQASCVEHSTTPLSLLCPPPLFCLFVCLWHKLCATVAVWVGVSDLLDEHGDADSGDVLLDDLPSLHHQLPLAVREGR